ncbi:hypothetical protein M3J07_011480 [Ascochyta lentis]
MPQSLMPRRCDTVHSTRCCGVTVFHACRHSLAAPWSRSPSPSPSRSMPRKLPTSFSTGLRIVNMMRSVTAMRYHSLPIMYKMYSSPAIAKVTSLARLQFSTQSLHASARRAGRTISPTDPTKTQRAAHSFDFFAAEVIIQSFPSCS